MSVPEPEDSHRNRPEGPVASGTLVVAGGEAAVLLAAGDEVLHAVAAPVDGAVERPAAVLVASARDGVADAPAPTVRRGAPGRCTPCRQRPDRAARGPAAARDAGRPRAPATARRRSLRGAGPGSAPASSACRGPRRGGGPSSRSRPGCAPSASVAGSPPLPRPRAGAPGSPCRPRSGQLQSSWPAASACALDGREDPVPDPGQRPAAEARVHRRPGPYRSGRSRQGAPVASFHRIPLTSADRRAAPSRPMGRQQRPQPLPLGIAQLMPSSHTPPRSTRIVDGIMPPYLTD